MSIQHGLEMAKQALSSQQSALNTTNNNISNAETDGYSRQRVNFKAMPGYPAAARNRPETSGQIGTGVDSGNVERIRNGYLDDQYRSENSNTGYWETRADAMSQMEDLMNEPSDNGLAKTLDQLRDSLQDLASNPDDSGARSVVAERGLSVTDTFNFLSESLHSIRSNGQDEIEKKEDKVNDIIYDVAGINEQIKNMESHGDLANDLYDKRDQLIDELSGYIDVEVSYEKSSDSSPKIADGLAEIKVVDEDENSLELLDKDGVTNEFDVSELNGKEEGREADPNISKMTGSLPGFIKMFGHDDVDEDSEYGKNMEKLNDMAKDFAKDFNNNHKDGYDLNRDKGEDFFTGSDPITAESIEVNKDILEDPDLIAASNSKDSNNGNNASELTGILDEGGNEKNIKSEYQSLISDIGVEAEKANKMQENSDTLRSQVENQRQSVSDVSLDEEMSNMIKYQHAYNAAARSMTTMDEMLDQVINNMGLAGR